MNVYRFIACYSVLVVLHFVVLRCIAEGPQVDGADDESQDELLKSAELLLSLANGV